MREFDDLDILLRNALAHDTGDTRQPSPRAWASLRRRILQRRRGRHIQARLGDAWYIMLDAMLLRGTNEPIYRVPLEGRLLSLLCFIM